jgi:hypothetical protein
MKYLVLLFCIAFVSCKKSDGNTAPQIKFKKVNSPFLNSTSTILGNFPKLTISVKDADGDYGFKEGVDTSYIYIKNVSYSPFKLDSFKFPSNLASANIINNWAEAEVDLRNPGNPGGGVLSFSNRPIPKTDTMYFEVYIKDFKKNKSNVIRTDDPLLYVF